MANTTVRFSVGFYSLFGNTYQDFTIWQTYWNMAKLVKWNIHVQHWVVFLRFSLLWGFSEDVLHLDNYMMTFCFFEFWYIYCVLYSIFFEIVFSEIIYFIHQIVVINNQISACALFGQSAMVYCAGKQNCASSQILYNSNTPQVSVV